QMIGWRTISLLAVGLGLSIVYQAAGKSDELVRCRGLWKRRALGVALLVGGVLSLAGFPLTPGAAGRWPLLVSLWTISPRTVWVLVLGGVGVCIGAIVGLRACLGQASEPVEEKRWQMVTTTGFALLALWIVGTLLLRPSPWLAIAERLLGDLSFLQ
ncbi:MAG: proton-conducting transporter membrane subunit, partial [Anaerolineae bacterium]